MSQEDTQTERSPSTVVIDSSALLALLFDEPGANAVVPHLSTGCISAVNLSEVAFVAVREGAKLPGVRDRLSRLPLDVVPFSAEHAYLAASLQPYEKSHNLSLGDRACLAVGMSLKRPVLTADRRWAKLPIEVEVRLVR